jgi:hypothetical protein
MSALPSVASEAAKVVGEEHWARKGPVSLFLWRKRIADYPPVILVHGSSLSALPTFDLTVPGQRDYSFMDWLSRRGLRRLDS